MLTVTARSGDDLKAIRSRSADFETMGAIVARTLESVSQRAFRDQKLGGFSWPERYPGQEDPFVNKAALVNWANEGGSVLSRFFDRRPALMGTGDLAQSISGRSSGNTVTLGSALPYAGIHQWGGTSTMPITAQAKKTIASFLGEEPDGRGGWRRKKRIGSRQAENREKYWFKLFPLLSSDILETQVNARPFLGIPTDVEEGLARDLERWVAEEKA